MLQRVSGASGAAMGFHEAPRSLRWFGATRSSQVLFRRLKRVSGASSCVSEGYIEVSRSLKGVIEVPGSSQGNSD